MTKSQNMKTEEAEQGTKPRFEDLKERLRRLGEDGSSGYGMPIAREALKAIETLEKGNG